MPAAIMSQALSITDRFVAGRFRTVKARSWCGRCEDDEEEQELHKLAQASHRFRRKTQIPRAIHKSEQAVTIIVPIAVGSLNNMIVEAK